jgi:hypothetical protein
MREPLCTSIAVIVGSVFGGWSFYAWPPVIALPAVLVVCSAIGALAGLVGVRWSRMGASE